MAAAVEAEGVSKRYGTTVALDGVSLSVNAGEVFALVGPNGAGKTTLVRTLTGTTRPDAGSTTVFDAPPTEIDRARIGLLPQAFTPPERLTAQELLRYYGGLYDEPRSVSAVLSDVGLEDDDDTWYTRLSGGQQRRVCVGIALINDPDLLFLDEPTTGIDPAGRQALWSLIADLAAEGTTVFLTTHYMEEAETLADRVGFLDAGMLVETGRPTTLIERFGGSTHLRIEMNESPSLLSERGYSVEATTDGVLVRGVAPTDIGGVVGILEAEGVEYGSLTWTQPDLEDAYLRLTDEATTEAVSSTPPLATTGGSR